MRASTVCYTASVLRQVAGTTLAVSTFALEAKTNTKWTRERHVCITLAAIFMEVEKKC